MTHRRQRRGRRSGFTLIELLVVIAILAILIGLTAAAVMRVLVQGPQLTTKSELAELDQRLGSARTVPGHEVDVLPSALILRKLNGYNIAGNAVEAATVNFLQRRFGRRSCYDFNPPPAGQFLDWNGDGNPNEVITLEGEQVLVFLLGGVPRYGNGSIAMQGFSENVQNPALQPQTQGERRQGPYFEFQQGRLRLLKSAPPYAAASASLANGAGDFPIYLDPWNAAPATGLAPWGKGMPYAFFASSRTEGGGLYNNDCPSLGVMPYFTGTTPTIQFVNPGSWQIVSAGQDGIFGPGGLWNPSQPAVPLPGQDDWANFSSHKLGIGN
jgi:prepilin-type N-terminal cleavage/methylation domain-containing protein